MPDAHAETLAVVGRLTAVCAAGARGGELSEVALRSVLDELEAVHAAHEDELSRLAMAVGASFLAASRPGPVETIDVAVWALPPLLALLADARRLP